MGNDNKTNSTTQLFLRQYLFGMVFKHLYSAPQLLWANRGSSQVSF